MPKSPVSGGLNAPIPPQGKIEDIFADTEKGTGFGVPAPTKTEVQEPVKPPIFQPVKTDITAAPAASGRLFSSSKIKFIGLIVLALIFVVAGTWYVYIKMLSPAGNNLNTTNNDVNIDNTVTNSENTETVNNIENTETPEQPAVEQPAVPVAPVIKDTDQDGLTDDEESALGTNINSNDTDNDGLFDREEVKVYLTDPLNNDTDGDGYPDGDEVVGGYNPKGAGKLLDINNSIK